MSSDTPTNRAQSLEPWFLELLACPACEHHFPLTLTENRDALLCKCGRYSYPIRDGIPVLLIDEATEIDSHARPEQVKS